LCLCLFVCLFVVSNGLCCNASRLLLSFWYSVAMILFNCELTDVCICYHTPLQLYMLPHTITTLYAATHHYNYICCHTPLQLYMLPHTIKIVYAATHHYNFMHILNIFDTFFSLILVSYNKEI
jgi:hypothetical protein